MGFTNVVWESRSTATLARDLTEGPGPASVGEAGAAWVRVANEFAAVSADYHTIVERLATVWQSQGATALARKLEGFGQWLQDISLAAATNGQRAEEAAVANTEAILAMPSVSEVVEAKATHDIMASLAAYNGAILNGNFAEFDEAARANKTDAVTVMRQYEDAVTPLAQPWEHSVPETICQAQPTTGQPGDAEAGGRARSVPAAAPPPLAAWAAPHIQSTAKPKPLQHNANNTAPAGTGGMGAGGYAPMGAPGRGGEDHEYESTRPAAPLPGGGEPVTGLSDSGQSWQPATRQAEFTVSQVSWSPNAAVFDEFPSVEQQPEPYESADGTQHGSERWISPVVGADGQLRL